MAEDINTRTFKMLVDEQKKTTMAIRALVQTDSQNTEKQEKDEADQRRVEAGKKAWRTRQENIAKAELAATQKANKPKGVSAAQEEANTDQRNYLSETFNKFLGKDSYVGGKLKETAGYFKSKIKGGLENLFGLLKTGAFLGMLLAATKFLQSPMFKELKDKYLPAVGEALQGMYDTFVAITKDFFVEGEDGKMTFSFMAGIKGIFGRIYNGIKGWFFGLTSIYKEGAEKEKGKYPLSGIIGGLTAVGLEFGKLALILGVGGTLLALIAPMSFFGAAWVAGKLFGGSWKLIKAGWGLLFGKDGLTGMLTSLDDTGKGFKTTLGDAKKTGPLRKGLGGILGRFKTLFRFLGRKGFTGLLIGVIGGMASFAAGPIQKLFTDGPKGIVTIFKSMFGVLKDFGNNVASLAKKGGDLLLKVVGGVNDTITKAAAKAANLIPTKAPKPPKLSADAMAALSGTGKYSVDAIAGTAPKAAAAASELASKTLQKSILKRSVGFGAKAIPIVGLLAGGYFALEKLVKGDFVGAGMETGGIFAPSLIGMPLDLAIMIRDIYNDVYKTAKRKFPFDGDLATDPKGTNSRLMKIKKDLFAYLGLSGDGKPIPKVGEGDIANVDPALAAAAGLNLPKSNTATMVGGSGSGVSGGGGNGGSVIVPQVIQQNVGGTSNSHHYGSSIKPDNFIDGIIKIQ